MNQRNQRGGRRPGAGRPKGVPNKLTRDVKALAADHTPAALHTLVEVMNGGQNEQARIAAAKELLDRAHGKPRQEVELDHKQVVVIVDRGGAAPAKLVENRAADPRPALGDHSTDNGEGGDTRL